MIRKIIHIDEDKCNGCGLCVDACHESAIGLKNNKAVLLKDDYCDGLGDCLPICPTNAITFEEREAAPYDEAAVMARIAKKTASPLPCGCPGSNARTLSPTDTSAPNTAHICAQAQGCCAESGGHHGEHANNPVNRLAQWPVQIKLVPVNAPYLNGARLLIAADCAAYAHAAFHEKFMRGKITLIGCPKLDEGDYTEKLSAIITNNDIQSVTVVRMEVPCCSGLEKAVKNALINSGKMIPWSVAVLTTDGKILDA